MTLRLDFSVTGVLNVTDTNDETVRSIVLQNVQDLGQQNDDTFTNEFTPREGTHTVTINEVVDNTASPYVIDIRDVEGEPYSTTQELIDEINAAIAAS